MKCFENVQLQSSYRMRAIYALFSFDFLATLLQNYQKIVKTAQILQKKKFTFGSRSNECQQRAQVFQWI